MKCPKFDIYDVIQMGGYKPLVRKGIWFHSRPIKTGKIQVKWELLYSLPGRDAETLCLCLSGVVSIVQALLMESPERRPLFPRDAQSD